MAQAKIDITIDGGKAGKTLGELEESAERLREELGKAEIGSQKYKELNQALIQTNTEVKNLELGFEALDSENVASEIGSVAGAVGDVTSAFVLLGGESETMEQMTANIQQALGVSMAFKGAIEGVSSAQKLLNNQMAKGTVIGKIATAVQKGFNMVLRANPIGLVITAIALLIGGLIFLAKNVSAVGETFSKMGGWLKTTIDGFGKFKYVILALLGPIGLLIMAWDFFFGEQAKHSAEELARLEAEKAARMEAKKVATEAHKARLAEIEAEKKALREAHEEQNERFDMDIKRMEAEGKNANLLKQAKIEAALEFEREELRIMQDLIDSWTQYYEDQFVMSGKSREDFLKQMKGQGIDIELLQAQAFEQLEEQNKKIYSAETDLIAFKTNLRKQGAKDVEEADKAEADSLKALTQARLDALDRIEAAENEYLDSKLSAQDQEINAVRDKYFELIELAIQNNEDTAILEEAQQARILEIKKKFAEEEAEVNQALIEQKQADQLAANEVLKQGATDLFNVANDFANHLSERDLKRAQEKTARGESLTANEIKRLQRQDKIQKAFAIAQIAADTARGISGAIAAGAGLPFPANLGAIASGVAAVLSGALQASKVLGESVDIPTPASTSASVDSGAGGGGDSTPQIDPLGFGSTLLNQPNKVYVTETDITGVQNKVATLEKSASFG